VILVPGLGLKAKIFGLGLGLDVTGLVNMNKATCAFSGGGEVGYSGYSQLAKIAESVCNIFYQAQK
jgi:hypothetical protein